MLAPVLDFLARLPAWTTRLWWLPPLLVVAFAWRTSAGFELVADARFLIVDNAFLTNLHDLWPNLTHDYFWSSSGNTIPYWRPWTKASWLFEKQLFGAWEGGYHLVQVAWLLVLALGAGALVRVLGTVRRQAALAVLLVGLHPAAHEAVGLVMARSDVVAAAGLTWAIVAWRRWRDTGGKGWLALHLLALVLALGSKEVAVIAAPLLTLWALLDLRAHRADSPGPAAPWPAELRRFLLPTLPAWALVVAYLGLRRLVLGPGRGADLVLDPLRFVVGFGTYLQGLLPFRFETSVRSLPRAEAAEPDVWLPALVVVVLLLAAFAWAAWRRRSGPAVLLAWIGLTLLPVLLVESIHVPGIEGKIPLADRWLLPAAVAASALFACLCAAVPRPLVRRVLAGLVLAWAAASVMQAADRHAVYADELTLLSLEDEHYLATPAAFRSAQDACRFATRAVIRAGRQGRTAEVIAIASALPPACRDEAEIRFNLFAALVQAGRTAEARPLLDDLLRRPPPDPRFHATLRLLGGALLLDAGDAPRAERLLREARQLGVRDCTLPLHLGRALAAQQRYADAHAALAEAIACLQTARRPVDPRMHLLAADAALHAHDTGAARRHLQAVQALRDLPPDLRSVLHGLQQRLTTRP